MYNILVILYGLQKKKKNRLNSNLNRSGGNENFENVHGGRRVKRLGTTGLKRRVEDGFGPYEEEYYDVLPILRIDLDTLKIGNPFRNGRSRIPARATCSLE